MTKSQENPVGKLTKVALYRLQHFMLSFDKDISSKGSFLGNFDTLCQYS